MKKYKHSEGVYLLLFIKKKNNNNDKHDVYAVLKSI